MILTKGIFAFVIFLLLLGGSTSRATVSSVESGCQEAIEAFISTPTEQSLAALGRLDQAGCWSVVETSNAILNRLDHSVKLGNRWAAQYLTLHLKQLDGGNLEDALRALGQFADQDMEQFLFLAHKEMLSKHEFTDALTMLPLSLSENPHAQLDLLSARKSKVMRISRADLSEQRTQALSAIKSFVSEIQSKNLENGY